MRKHWLIALVVLGFVMTTGGVATAADAKCEPMAGPSGCGSTTSARRRAGSASWT